MNLSDGGHFDNLGLYELVRRRCRYIIIGDGEQDGALTFGSLGGAIRKCRADFGVEIEIDPTPIRLKADGRSKTHCVVGTITYPEIDPRAADDDEDQAAGGGPSDARLSRRTSRARGWILYLKSSLTGNEPADVIEYQSRNPDFPHQSTGDQFFSESQFESYRRLGLHVVREALEGVTDKVGAVTSWTATPSVSPVPAAPSSLPSPDPAAPSDPPDASPKSSAAADLKRVAKCKKSSSVVLGEINLKEIFQDLTAKWYPGVPLTDEAASRLNDQFSDLIKRLGDAKTPSKLLDQLMAGQKDAQGQPIGHALDAETLVFLVQQLGLMENVFTEFHFEHAANRANPRNRGWMRVFRQWVQNEQLYSILWPRVKNSYNPLFQKFVGQLREDIDDVPTQN